MIRQIKNILITIFILLTMSGCYIWILIDYFGPFSKFEKEYTNKHTVIDKSLNKLNSDVYDKFVDSDTTVKWYDLIFISKYSVGLGYFIDTPANCKEYNDSISYKTQTLKVKKLISDKYKMNTDFIDFVQPVDCSDTLSIYSFTINRFKYPKNDYIIKFMSDTLIFVIRYEKFDKYIFYCQLSKDGDKTDIQLSRLITWTRKDYTNKENLIENKALRLFKTKIVNKIN